MALLMLSRRKLTSSSVSGGCARSDESKALGEKARKEGKTNVMGVEGGIITEGSGRRANIISGEETLSDDQSGTPVDVEELDHAINTLRSCVVVCFSWFVGRMKRSITK